MKKLFPIICTSLFLYTTISYGADDDLQPCLLPSASQADIDLSPPTFTPRKSPFIAVGLSSLLPGLGHAYLGDLRTAGTLFGSSSVFATMSSINTNNETFTLSSRQLLGNTWMYGIYAAYRDVRAYNQQDFYAYKMPTESFKDLAFAPFQWSVIKKPEVWAGLLVDLSLAVGLSYLVSSKESKIGFSADGEIFPLVAFPVGIGEESFFRGFLQSSLSETFTPFGGIAISSLAFGAAHIPNGALLEHMDRRAYYTTILPFITISGFYYGWVTYKNCSLKESVALHSWYDFVIFLASYSVAQSTVVGNPSFSFSLPF